MSAIDVGRVCLKIKGRERGMKCIIVDIIDRNYVLVTGPKDLTGVRRRRVNISHLEFLDENVNIGKNASDEEVTAAFEQLQYGGKSE